MWKSPRYLSSLSRLLTRMVTIAGVLFGLATNTCVCSRTRVWGLEGQLINAKAGHQP